ncbi:MAG: hypothetical protein NTZ27_01015 [Ignavibacteriales bacterium]|nr:hypothetical protein [Ignavibacteriales bacterium]
MKKFVINILSLLLIASSFISCDKIPDGIVDSQTADHRVLNVTAPANFTPTSTDSFYVTSLKIENPGSVNEVWCTVKILGATKNIYDRINLFDNGDLANNGDVKRNDSVYTGKFLMSRQFSSGEYVIEYFVKDNINNEGSNVTNVVEHQFVFNNGKNNKPPVISDLTMPPSVNRNVDFVIQVKVSDPDGLADISRVEFNLYQPGGSYIGKFALLDDGNTASDGDITAGDGIYSSKRSFRADVTPGVWKFVFQATDLVGNPSNTITSYLTIN